MNKWNDVDVLRQIVAEEFTEVSVIHRLGLKVNSASRSRLRYYVELYNIDSSHFQRQTTSEKWKSVSRRELLEAVSSSNSLTEVCIKLGVSSKGSAVNVVKRHIVKYGIDMSHLTTARVKGGRYWSTARIPNEQLFVSNSKSRTDTAKSRIVKEKLIDYRCAGCGNDGSWRGKKLTLQLEHKNGVPTDHRLENLEFLCPNCHTQTSTWGSRNKVISQ